MSCLLPLSLSSTYLFPAPSAPPCGHGSRPNVACLHGWAGLRRCSPAGNDPQLNAIFLAEPTVHNSDARLVDAPLRHEVVSSAIAEQVCLAGAAGATAVGNDVSSCCRIVLQFNSKVIQPSFLIVKRATATDVKLLRRMFYALRWSNESRSLWCLTAGSLA